MNLVAVMIYATLGLANAGDDPGIAYRQASGTAQEIAPRIFAPGVISGGAHDAAPAFSPDGRTVYFSRSNPSGAAILVSRRTEGGWSRPELASFSGEWNDLEPAMAPDGSYLLFVSNRPPDGDGRPLDGFFNGRVQPGQGGNIWRVDRQGDGWGTPRRLPDAINRGSSVFAPSVARDGTVYFMRPDDETHRFRLYAAAPRGDGYESPQPLPFSTGASTDVDPAVDPGHRFLIFGSGRKSDRGIDLFIAFRTGRGWSLPIHLGDGINTGKSDAEPRLGADGTTLFFSSERMIPQAFPRSRAVAEEAMQTADRWNNGLYNIWTIPIADVLENVVGTVG